MDYEKDICIEPDALDIEWVRQPFLYMEYAQEAARLDSIAKQKKEHLEVVDAQIDKVIRESNVKKPTEPQIRNEILLNHNHQQAYQEYIDALYEYNICIAGVRALDNKKSALENLVKLWQGSYFAGPKEPRDISSEMNFQNKIEEDTRRRIKESMNKKQ